MSDRNCLSYWFPKLKAAGLPVPKTEIIRADAGALGRLFQERDDGAPDAPADTAAFDALVESIPAAAGRLGYPAFLRTGQGSGKHSWKKTCYLPNAAEVPQHVGALVQWSQEVDMIGLPVDTWVVREMLPTELVATLPAYGDMPLVPELRYFVGDGTILCKHYYWPAGALLKGFYTEPENFAAVLLNSRRFPGGQEQLEQANALAQWVADLFAGDGSWSVDILPTPRKGLYITDMAEADRSFHWPGCPNAPAPDLSGGRMARLARKKP